MPPSQSDSVIRLEDFIDRVRQAKDNQNFNFLDTYNFEELQAALAVISISESYRKVFSQATSRVFLEKDMQIVSDFFAARLDNNTLKLYVKNGNFYYEAFSVHCSYIENLYQVAQSCKFINGKNCYSTFVDASTEELANIITEIEVYLGKEEYNDISRILATINVANVQFLKSIAILRTTYMHRDRIKNWKDFYDRVYIFLSEIGRNPDYLLRGLT